MAAAVLALGVLGFGAHPAAARRAGGAGSPVLTLDLDSSADDHRWVELSANITRTDTSATDSGLGFAITLPTGLVAASLVDSNSCGGTASVSVDGATLTLGAGELASGADSCYVLFLVSSPASGTYQVTAGNVSVSGDLVDDVTTQTLVVSPAIAELDGDFTPALVAPGHTTTLSLSLMVTDENRSAVRAGLGYTVTLPDHLTVAAGGRHNGCGGTLTAVTGTAVIRLAAGRIAAATSDCALSVPVTTLVPGDYVVGPGQVDDVSGVGPYFGCPALARGRIRPHVPCAATMTVTEPAPPPQVVTATAGVSSITAYWTAPVDTTGITGYRAIAHPGPSTCTTRGAHATTCLMGGTAGVTYTVTVVALSPTRGDSAPAGPSNEVTPTGPPVPGFPPATPLTLTTDRGLISTVAPGEHLVVIGTGFAPYSTALVVLYPNPTVLGRVVTDGHGDFHNPVTVPAALAAGHHTVVASGVDPRGRPHYLRMGLVTGQDEGDGELAPTGTPLYGLVLAGSVLILSGSGARLAGGAAAATRRRRDRGRSSDR